MVVTRAARSNSSVRDRRISSVKSRTRIVFLHRIDRANRGLLTEATATETAGASPATGTKRRSASALAAISRRTAPNGRKKDEIGVGGMVEAGVCATRTSEKPVERKG